MIGPVFGSQNKDTPCAIIQFINKIDPVDQNQAGKIAEAVDIAKFKSMQNLLGMCVENTNEMSQTIKVSFDVQDTMANIQKAMQEENDREKDNDTDALVNQLLEHLNNIKINNDKLSAARKDPRNAALL